MCEQARPSASVPFFSLLKQTRGAQLRGLPLWCLARKISPFFLRKKRAGGERRLWAATPHQSPFGRQLPLKGKPFGELRPGKSLPLEGKVLSVAKRMRCSAPQSALPSNPLVSPQRNGGPPRALPHKKSAGPDGCAVRAREARRKRERRPSDRACSHPWNPLSFSISLP